MRTLAWILAIAALAIALALLARTTAGYVQVVVPPYRVEMSVVTAAFMLLGAFVALHLLLRFAAKIAAMPAEVRAHRSRTQLERARAKQDAALRALIEGRVGRARELADEALALPRSTGLPGLIGARAAADMRDFDASLGYLARADVRVASLAVPRMMLEAEIALEQGQSGVALEKLEALKREAGAHTAAQRLALRALGAAGRSAEIPPVVDQLVKRKVYDAEQGNLLKARAHADALSALATDARGLREYWNRLSEAERLQPKVALAAARSFTRLGGDREAADLLAKSLEQDWNDELLLAWTECRPADATRQLEQAERWLAGRSQDATLLYALGRLCERAQLWGKAQTYYEASIALSDHWRPRVTLGGMLARLGRPDEANLHLGAALKLALAELGAGGPGAN